MSTTAIGGSDQPLLINNYKIVNGFDILFSLTLMVISIAFSD